MEPLEEQVRIVMAMTRQVQDSDLIKDCLDKAVEEDNERRDGTGIFISCSRYPKCKFIRSDEAEEAKKRTGVLCPLCKTGDISERRGRFGIFYSCSNYPNCKFAIKAKPTGNICKECGSLMMEGTKTIPERCSNKSCPMHNPHKLNKMK